MRHKAASCPSLLKLLVISSALLCAPRPAFAAESVPSPNLVSWESISNRWASVPTNRLFTAAQQGDAGAQYFLGRARQEALHGLSTNLADSYVWIERAARQGLADAQNRMGWMHSGGAGFPPNLARAVEWYALAATQGLAKAEFNLAQRYQAGVGVQADQQQAIAWFRRAAVHGLPFAKCELGRMLMRSDSLAEAQEGVAWLEAAAKDGFPSAQFLIGQVYSDGRFVKRSRTEARRWFLKAAEQGYSPAIEHGLRGLINAPDCPAEVPGDLARFVPPRAEKGEAWAQFLLGEMYQNGNGLPRDVATGLLWWERACLQNYPSALEMISQAYYTATSVTNHRAKALEWGLYAARRGNPMAQQFVSGMFLNGDGASRDVKQGLEFLSMAATNDDVQAQVSLADIYASGQLVPRDTALATFWLTRAATNRLASSFANDATMRLGIMSATGDGVKQDDKAAMQWFRLAANYRGAIDAMDSIGYMLALGRGEPRNDKEAVKWFEEAADPDRPADQATYFPAFNNLGVMYALGRGGLKTNASQAVDLFRRAIAAAAAQQCELPQARTALGLCLYKGEGVERNLEAAFAQFKQAAEGGHPQAQLHAGLLCWRGEGVGKDVRRAFMYFHLAAEQAEPEAAAWRDRCAKELAETEQAQARQLAASQVVNPACRPMNSSGIWNSGLRLPNLAQAGIEAVK